MKNPFQRSIWGSPSPLRQKPPFDDPIRIRETITESTISVNNNNNNNRNSSTTSQRPTDLQIRRKPSRPHGLFHSGGLLSRTFPEDHPRPKGHHGLLRLPLGLVSERQNSRPEGLGKQDPAVEWELHPVCWPRPGQTRLRRHRGKLSGGKSGSTGRCRVWVKWCFYPCMFGWMDEWMFEWMDGWVDGWVDG